MFKSVVLEAQTLQTNSTLSLIMKSLVN